MRYKHIFILTLSRQIDTVRNDDNPITLNRYRIRGGCQLLETGKKSQHNKQDQCHTPIVRSREGHKAQTRDCNRYSLPNWNLLVNAPVYFSISSTYRSSALKRPIDLSCQLAHPTKMTGPRQRRPEQARRSKHRVACQEIWTPETKQHRTRTFVSSMLRVDEMCIVGLARIELSAPGCWVVTLRRLHWI